MNLKTKLCVLYCRINQTHLNVVDERRLELLHHALKMTGVETNLKL